VIKSRRMRWTERVERVREKRNAYRILIRKSERKGLFGNISMYVRII
jgi:hypothetical protein